MSMLAERLLECIEDIVGRIDQVKWFHVPWRFSERNLLCLFKLSILITLQIPVQVNCFEMDTSGDNSRVDTTMAVARVPTPPPIDMLCPMAENWCYTQVGFIW